MSAAAEVQRATVARLGAAVGIAGVATGVFDGPPPRAAFPYLTVETGSADWSHKTARGREVRVAVTAWDEAGQAARLQALAGAAEAAVEGLPRGLPGWRVASIAFLRGRSARPAGGAWAAVSEFRVRVVEG